MGQGLRLRWPLGQHTWRAGDCRPHGRRPEPVAKIDQQSGGLRPGEDRPVQSRKLNKQLIINDLYARRSLEAKMPYSCRGTGGGCL
jgi:hypothetical protein